MKTAFFDVESIGYYGAPVIIQVAFDDGDPFIHNVWLEPVHKTLSLIEKICECRVVAHNLTFDWMKLQSLYNALQSFEADELPIDDIDGYAWACYKNRSMFCLKPPKAVCTLMLCQKQLGGSFLAAKEIRVRQLPERTAQLVADKLNEHTNLPDILHARRQDKGWVVNESDHGDAWRDVVMRFAPSNALKDVAELVLGEKVIRFDEAEPPSHAIEEGFAPYAVLLDEGDWLYTPKPTKSKPNPAPQPLWPRLLRDHVYHWENQPTARQYALDDVTLLRKVFRHFDSPDTDFDGELGCQVASVRMAGMTIDTEKLEVERVKSQKVIESAKINVDSPKQVRNFIADALDELEAFVVADGCNDKKLKKIISTFVLDEEEKCCKDGCQRCDGKGTVGPGPMPVVERAKHVRMIRKHRKRVQLYNKLDVSKEAFPSFKVVGTKSGRMSGADGLNYHGIDGSGEIREIFTLAEDGWVVSGGDFDSQELAITAAVMKEDRLVEDMQEGNSMHALFAADISGIPYEQIMQHKEDKSRPEANWYKLGKIGVYSILYGASARGVSYQLGISEEEAEQAIINLLDNYANIKETRKTVRNALKSLKSLDGGRLRLDKPDQTFIDSCFGYRRSFETEFEIMEGIIQAMEEIKDHLIKVQKQERWPKLVRKDKKGPQTVAGAVSSALYGAAFSVEGKILRAAMNHLIQSAGRTITLRVQHRIWTLQPVGANPFRLKLLSVHDEIGATSTPEDAELIEELVADEVDQLTETVPLLSLEWVKDVGSWRGIKDTEGGRVCGWGS